MKNILEEIKTKLNSNLQAEDDIPPTSEITKLVSVQIPAASSLDFGPMNRVAKMMKGLEEDETTFTFIKFLTRVKLIFKEEAENLAFDFRDEDFLKISENEIDFDIEEKIQKMIKDFDSRRQEQRIISKHATHLESGIDLEIGTYKEAIYARF